MASRTASPASIPATWRSLLAGKVFPRAVLAIALPPQLAFCCPTHRPMEHAAPSTHIKLVRTQQSQSGPSSNT